MDNDLSTAYWLPELFYHASSLLLIIALAMRSLNRLRLFVLASAVLGVIYNLLWLSPSGVFWQIALLAVVLIRIVFEWRENGRASFSPEERTFLDNHMPGLAPVKARKLLSEGTWLTGKAGTTLTEEGEPVLFLTYLSEGEVDVSVDGKVIGHCHPGSYVGELSLLHSAPASATATIRSPARYWTIPTIKMRDFRKSDPDIWQAFEAGLSQDLGNKILEMNESVTKSE